MGGIGILEKHYRINKLEECCIDRLSRLVFSEYGFFVLGTGV
jgi:hypothetical protein